MRALLDTSVLIGQTAPEQVEAAISVASIAELHFGVLVARDDDERALRTQRLGAVEATFDPLPLTTEVAREWGRLAAAVSARGGQPRKRTMDLAIAATANVYQVTLLTDNTSDFEIIADLVDAQAPAKLRPQPPRVLQDRSAREISIGKLNAEDKNAWQRLFQGYLDFYKTSLDDAAFDHTWDMLAHDDVAHALGAKIDGQLVGIAHFLEHASTTAPNVCYLQDLFTDPSSRGQGVASALINAVVDASRSRGCSRVYWVTHESNATARRLYDQLAFNSGFIRYQIAI